MKHVPWTDPNKCARCVMLKNLCICDLMPSIVTRSKLCLIIQAREILKPTNTGALAAHCLVNSEVHVRGREGEPLDQQAMLEENYTSLFLFPTHNSQPLTPEFVKNLGKPVKLVVADGNWGQAIRAHRRFARATGVATVHLPAGEPTAYKLRVERERPEGLATLEAIARAFAILEGAHVEEQLLHIFKVRVDRLLWARGQLPASAVYGGLPTM